ncbi:hypothetical protein ACMFWY_13495 [Roseiconus sp. JC912]
MFSGIRSLVIGFCILSASSLHAGILTIELGGAELTNSMAGTIASDAIVVVFDDMGTPGTVRMTIDFNGGFGVRQDTKLNDIVFNLNPAQSITSISYLEGVKATKNGNPSIFWGANSVGSGGLAGADVYFDFPPPGSDPPFLPDSKSVYEIAGVGLTAQSFNFSGGNQPMVSPFVAAVHLNAVTADGKSGHYAGVVVSTPPDNPPSSTPEPGAFAIFAALTGMLVGNRKRKLAASC